MKHGAVWACGAMRDDERGSSPFAELPREQLLCVAHDMWLIVRVEK